jgi:hypothetical protein
VQVLDALVRALPQSYDVADANFANGLSVG